MLLRSLASGVWVSVKITSKFKSGWEPEWEGCGSRDAAQLPSQPLPVWLLSLRSLIKKQLLSQIWSGVPAKSVSKVDIFLLVPERLLLCLAHQK